MELQENCAKKFRPDLKSGFSEPERRRLKDARLASGLTLAQLALGSGYDETTFCAVENGPRVPTARLLKIWEARLLSNQTGIRRVKTVLPSFRRLTRAMRRDLQARRKALGLTFAQFADGTGYALTTFSGVENGNDQPSPRLLAAWKKRLASLEKRPRQNLSAEGKPSSSLAGPGAASRPQKRGAASSPATTPAI